MSNVVKNTKCDENNPNSQKSIYGTANSNSNLNSLYDDKFDTVLDLPACLKHYNRNVNTIYPISLDKLELSVRTISIPEISIPSQKVAYGVGSYTEGGTKYDDFSDTTIQFKLDDTMQNYWLLYKWMNMLVDIDRGVVGEYNKQHYSTIYNVFLLNQYKRPIGVYTFHGVTPVNLGGFPLDNNSDGAEVYIDFTFSYDRLSFDLKVDLDN